MRIKLNKVFLGVALIFLCLPFFVSANVVINEVAWMGTDVSTADEWIELRNTANEDIILDGWTLNAQDGTPSINLIGTILANGHFLLERTDDDTVPDVVADQIFTGAIENSDEFLELRNSSGVLIDSVSADEVGWPAGDNSTKETMQKSGLTWFTAIGTPRSQNAGLPSEPPPDSGQLENQSDIGWPEYVSPEDRPGLKAYAGKDKVLPVGVLGEFLAEAYGLEDKLLDKARYLWNFGDGMLQEGRKITHSYHFPGTYTVILDVSSGEYTASSRLTVKVVQNEIFISEIKTGIESFIELNNPSKYEVDISGWRLKFNDQTFTFAKNTFLSKQSFAVFPIFSSGLLFSDNQGLIEFLYPGGFLADSFNYSGILKKGESFSKIREEIIVTSETPGEKNTEVQYVEVESPSIDDDAQFGEVRPQSIEKVESFEIKDIGATTSQANIITAVQNSQESNKTLYYLFGVMGLSVFAGVGIFLIRRQRSL